MNNTTRHKKEKEDDEEEERRIPLSNWTVRIIFGMVSISSYGHQAAAQTVSYLLHVVSTDEE